MNLIVRNEVGNKLGISETSWESQAMLADSLAPVNKPVTFCTQIEKVIIFLCGL